MLLKELTMARGMSGDEHEIREVIKSYINSHVDECRRDITGNLYAIKSGRKIDKKVMLAAHMDEVGLMITSITDSGMLKFRAIGGIDDRILASKRVLVGTKKIPGIIGIKPVHLLEGNERKQGIKIKQVYIDIGCTKKEEAERLVSLGDYVYYDSEFVDMGNGILKSKAFDDRVGCAVLIEILKQRYEFTLQACFTVQEEIGLRGSGIAAYTLKPDIAIIIEGTTCSDVAGSEEHEMVTRMRGGPAISIIDKTSIGNKGLVKALLETARENNIKVQIKEGVYGGTDAGKIQTSMEGIPTVVISIPCRYIHSPNSIMCIDDLNDTVNLIDRFFRKLEGNNFSLETKISPES